MITRTVSSAVALLLSLGLAAPGQSVPSSGETQEANLKAYIEMLRKDLKREKVAILTELMQFSPEESARFWPVYNEYDKALTKLADARIALVRIYAENHSALADSKALELANGFLDVEARRNHLKKQYFDRVCQAVSVKQAARFLQIENQIEKVLDLQILSSLPIVE